MLSLIFAPTRTNVPCAATFARLTRRLVYVLRGDYPIVERGIPGLVHVGIRGEVNDAPHAFERGTDCCEVSDIGHGRRDSR